MVCAFNMQHNCIIYIYIYVHIYMHYIYTHVYIYVYIYIYIYIYIYLYTKYLRICIYIYVFIYTCAYIGCVGFPFFCADDFSFTCLVAWNMLEALHTCDILQVYPLVNIQKTMENHHL